jgi:triosephosphate isomerase (TIM)
MSRRRPLVAGNWKLNGSRVANGVLVREIMAGLDGAVDVLVCPPFVYLAELAGVATGSQLSIGAQDVAAEDSGAFTGEVAASMLRDVGCEFVIVGHSERRALFGDTDDVTARKVAAALRSGLRPILCVGETLKERDAGVAFDVVRRQLATVLDHVGVAAFAGVLMAYEPVWAIGTGRTATPEQAQAIHAEIRATVAQRSATIAGSLRILYGGSVKAANAKDLFAMPDIDGGLIGGASLDAAEFLTICKAAATRP